ncbi:MAG TPA: DUF349 domain-containing protein [Segeticoccus sp.]|uniref:DUF349 domain-containing protein n=1 Tax=Segeticoccus sp. TaxID=2706531 RepID=UPI002D7FFFC5|nr:DUF349 domain-containing protein [Segeticoccus sp.]HET8599637.1 DUF349 domain-containing protein [Segeticoccus sp.]
MSEHPDERPEQTPPRPSPAAMPARQREGVVPAPAARPTTPIAPVRPATDGRQFGRVAEDGTVFVRTGDGERSVGSYPGATDEEALAFFARKYDDLDATVELLLQRVTQTDLPAQEAQAALKSLRQHTAEPAVVGDLDALADKVRRIEEAVGERRKVEEEQRAAARAESLARREEIVAEAERIAAQPAERVQWKASGARMRALLDEWKAHQRSGARLDKPTENALWQRFSAARNGFDKARRSWFSELEGQQAEAKATKERLVKEAEALAASKDWGPTATAYKKLMDRWRAAGRASRGDDDALWARFKAAQDSFFTAKDEVNAQQQQEFEANLAVKEELLTEAEAILPVTDLDAAKAKLRGIQDRWDAAGKVPRKDIERVEKAMRRIEQVVREADEKRWHSTNPEAAARAQSLVDQLESAVAGLRDDLARAEAGGDERKIADARAALEAREQWLAQARAGVEEFGS